MTWRGRDEAGHQVQAWARQLSWETAAAQTLRVYDDALERSQGGQAG